MFHKICYDGIKVKQKCIYIKSFSFPKTVLALYFQRCLILYYTSSELYSFCIKNKILLLLSNQSVRIINNIYI